MNNWLEFLPPIAPLHFFSLVLPLKKGKESALPDTTPYLGEERFADVKMKWAEDGFTLHFTLHKPFEEALYPAFAKGDSIELFFYTRSPSSANHNTPFSHHFVILPEAVQRIQAQEITKFRGEENHPLCDPAEIAVKTTYKKKEFSVYIQISAQALHGFEPGQVKQIGFTYRINRPGAPPQHFALSSKLYTLEQQPMLWATLDLSG